MSTEYVQYSSKLPILHGIKIQYRYLVIISAVYVVICHVCHIFIAFSEFDNR